MWEYNNYRLCLYHHGILGQKWGKRNGPPYPLDAGDHSQSEKKAGWRKSLDKSEDDSYNKKEKQKLSDKQKKALIATAAVVGTALAAYGGYKLYSSGKLDPFISKGKAALQDKLYQGIPDIPGIKKLKNPETISEIVEKVNPNREKTNCASCAIAGFLRLMGYDAKSVSVGENGLPLYDVITKCFKGADDAKYSVVLRSAGKFGRSREDAAEMLVRKFGDNASGIVGVKLKPGIGDGHAFNWTIKDGIVSFFDAQKGFDNDTVSKHYWDLIDASGALTLARLDGLELLAHELTNIIS